jgi:membrane-associated phospholipid phosphatase
VHHGPARSAFLRRAPGLSIVSLAGFLALALISAGQQLSDVDHRVRALVQLARLPWLDIVMRAVSSLGENHGLIPLIALGSAILWRPSRRWAVTLPILMAGTGALQLIAKWAVDRPRPNLAAWGFPSGHALSLVVYFGLITYLLATSTAARSRRRLGYAGCVAIVLAVGFSRLYLEAHWVSDVAGGLTLGLAYLLTTISLVEGIARRRGAGSPSEAQVHLADDQPGVVEVDPVVVAV